MSEDVTPQCRRCGQNLGSEDRCFDLDTRATRYLATHIHLSRCIAALCAEVERLRANLAQCRMPAEFAQIAEDNRWSLYSRDTDDTARKGEG